VNLPGQYLFQSDNSSNELSRNGGAGKSPVSKKLDKMDGKK
jgi:hypothetical protein